MAESGQLDILIRLVADLTGANLTKQQFEEIKSKAAESMQSAGQDTEGFALSGEKLRSVLASIVPEIAALGSITGVIATFKQASAEFAAWEEKIVGVNAVLANTNQLSAENSTRITTLAEAYEKATTIGAEHWIDAQSTLLRIGRVRMDDMDKELKMVENLAGLTGKNLSEAAFLYAKALEGNFTMLERLLPDLRDHATVSEKLVALSHDLARGQGVLAAEADTNAGANRRLANSWHELLRAIGNSDLAAGITMELANGVRDLVDAIPGAEVKLPALANAISQVQQAGDHAGDGLEAIGDKTKKGADVAMDALDALMSELDKIQHRTDELTDAHMAADIARAKLAGEQAKAKLDPLDKEGRRQIDDDTAVREDQIRDEYKQKKLADERQILAEKQAAIDSEFDAQRKAFDDAESQRKAALATHAQDLKSLYAMLLDLDRSMGLSDGDPRGFATMVGDGNYGGIYRELQRTSGGKLTDATRQSYLNATQNALTSQEAVESATRNANAVGGQITGETPRVKDARAQVATEVARNKSESDASTFDTLAGELKAQNDARVRSAEAIAAAQKTANEAAEKSNAKLISHLESAAKRSQALERKVDDIEQRAKNDRGLK